MKVLYCLTKISGGVGEAAVRLARRLGRSYEFLFVLLARAELLDSGSDLADGENAVHVLVRGPGLDWNCAHRLAALIRRERADLVHAHQHAAFLYSLTARLFYRRPPVLLTEHERRYPDHPSRKRVMMNRMLLGARDRVVAASQSVRRALIYNEGLPPGRIEVIYDGIELAAMDGISHDRRLVRQEIGMGADDLLILQVARPDPRSDHALALQVMEQVVRLRPEAHLVLIGREPEIVPLRELIHRRGLGPHVHLLGQRTGVARLLAAADLVLLTSLSENAPRALIEAMAAGRPVVATRVGDVGELVDDGISGMLACAGDYATLAKAILHLGGDPVLRQQMGQRGRERAEALFSEAEMEGHYDRIYRKMIDAPGNPS
jgi:glycosyltransferase involved in cell wall biosynthesis